MTTKSEWLALAERCEQATGPDCVLSIDISRAAGLIKSGRSKVLDLWDSPAVSASIDAITALINQEFPGWVWALYSDSLVARSPRACVRSTDYKIQVRADADTPALALCAAFCRAKAEMSE